MSLSTLHLTQAQFSATCALKHRSTEYWNGKAGDVLNPGEIVRVHTGKSTDAWSMRTEDRAGVHRHAYAEKGWFVLNNTCGDIIGVWWKDASGNWHREDETYYDPNPPEGAVLTRVGNKLVP